MASIAAPEQHMPDCTTLHSPDEPCETHETTVAGVTTNHASDGLAYLYAEPGFRDIADLDALITHLQGLRAAMGGAR